MKCYTKTENNLALKAQVLVVGDELCLIVSGGDTPHIGSVSIAVPRPSLSDPAKISATTSTYNFVGHMDDKIGNLFAEKLAAFLNKKIVVTCGIHVNNISEDQMVLVKSLAERLLNDIIADL